MSPSTFQEKIDSRNADLVFVAVVVAGYASTLLAEPELVTAPPVILLIGLGILYTLVGIYGAHYCEQAGSKWWLSAYFTFQIALSGTIVYLSWDYSGAISLVIFPLVAQSVAFLPTRGVVVVCALILLSILVPIGLIEGWANTLPSAFGLLAGIVFVALFTQIAIRETKARAEIERLAAELNQANQKLRQYAAQVEELATTQERNRLAREIHDNLGHYLTVINVQLEAARTILASDPNRAFDALSKAQSLTQEGLSEVRRSVAALRASPLENQSLPEAVSALVDECCAAGITTELTVTGPPHSLAAQIKLALYRAAQEGLTNVRKHAQASRANLILDYSDAARVRLVVQDNGVGQTAAGAKGGFGLLGLRERVQLLGGQVQTETRPGEGFTLSVEIPTERPER